MLLSSEMQRCVTCLRRSFVGLPAKRTCDAIVPLHLLSRQSKRQELCNCPMESMVEHNTCSMDPLPMRAPLVLASQHVHHMP